MVEAMATIITPEYLAKNGTEHGEQAALFCWANMVMRHGFTVANNMLSWQPGAVPWNPDAMAYPMLKWMHAIPNGGGRSAAQGGMLKAEGVKPGVSDICLPYRTARYSGLYIELKREKGKPSDVKADQEEFLLYVREQGFRGVVAFGWRHAADYIQEYLS